MGQPQQQHPRGGSHAGGAACGGLGSRADGGQLGRVRLPQPVRARRAAARHRGHAGNAAELAEPGAASVRNRLYLAAGMDAGGIGVSDGESANSPAAASDCPAGERAQHSGRHESAPDCAQQPVRPAATTRTAGAAAVAAAESPA